MFYHLEHISTLDHTSDYDLFCLHFVFLPRITNSLERFVHQWNNHRIRREGGLPPNQMWLRGILDASVDFATVSDDYGIDKDANTVLSDSGDEESESEDIKQVRVQPIRADVPDEFRRRLELEIDPLMDDGGYGIHHYLRARTIANSVAM